MAKKRRGKKRYPTDLSDRRWDIIKTMKRRLILSAFLSLSIDQAWGLPQGFVYLDEAIPDIAVELRYHSTRNFVGHPIDGYKGERAILSAPAAAALAEVQAEVRGFGLGIMIFDAYRPQRAVDHFVRWAKDLLSDTKRGCKPKPQKFWNILKYNNLYQDNVCQ